MPYLVNIGNTHTQVGVMMDGSPSLLARYDTPVLLGDEGRVPLFEDDSELSAVVSSVVPALTLKLRRRYGNRLRFLRASDFSCLDFSMVDVSTVGMDRIANAAGALQALGSGPVIVLDCGTCLVTEAVDASNRFCGGAILAGRMMLRRGLADYTAQLPLVPLQGNRPSPLGRNTHDAILAGVDLGVLGTIRQLIAETRQEMDATDCPVLVTGGDARFFLEHLPELSAAPDLLTIRGIALAANGGG